MLILGSNCEPLKGMALDEKAGNGWDSAGGGGKCPVFKGFIKCAKIFVSSVVQYIP